MTADGAAPPGLSLVIPFRDETRRLDALLARVTDWATAPERELVLVDDGSADDGPARVADWATELRRAHPEARVQVLRLSPGEGKGGAVRAGLLAARGERVAFTDADLPYGLDGVERALAALDEADVAAGARDLPGSDASPAPLARRVTSGIFRAWVRLWVDTGAVTDTQCGLKAYRRAAARQLFVELSCRGFAFDIEALALARRLGLRVARVPVRLQTWLDSTVSVGSAGPRLLWGTLSAARAVARRDPAAPPRARLDGAVAATAALLVLGVLLLGPDGLGGRDWDQFQADLQSARRSLLAEGELPLWQPYRVGGHDAFADPQSLWPSPLGLCAVALGVGVGSRVFLALAAGAAALGAARLAGTLGAGPGGRAAAAVLYAVSPPLGLYAAGGIPTFTLGLALLPWLVLTVLRGSRASALAGGALLALDLYGGDVNHFLFHSLFLGGLGLLLVASEGRGRRPGRLGHGVLLFAAAAVVAAPKLASTGLLARELPRETSDAGRGALTWPLLGRVLLDRDAVRFVEEPYAEFVALDRGGALVSLRGVPLERVRPETAVDWVNVGSYLGVWGLALALLGGAAALAGALHPGGASARAPPPRLIAALLVSGVLFLWMGWGSNAPASPWRALQQLPVFASLRSPGRLVLYPWFVLTVLAGLGAESVLARLRRRSARLAGVCAVALCLGLLADVFGPSWTAYDQAFVEPTRSELARSDRFVSVAVRRPPGSTYYGPPVTPFARAGVAVTNGYAAVPVEPRAVPRGDPRYRGEAFALEPGTDVGELVATARRLEVPVRGAAPATVVVNQNWAAGWAAVAPPGAAVRRHTDGRLAVEVPAGDARVVLRYTSPGLVAGVVAGLVGGPLWLLLAWWLPAPGPVRRG